MAKYIIKGSNKLEGKVKISGSKNAALPIIAASILNAGKTTLYNVPNIHDTQMMFEILKNLGGKVEKKNNKIIIDTSKIKKYEIPEDLMRQMRSSVILAGSLIGKYQKAIFSYPGGCDIGTRPIDLHLKGFEKLGINITKNYGNISCICDKIVGEKIDLDFPSVGATENIMLASCLGEGTTQINNAAREPEIIDLQNFLNKMGAKIQGAGSNKIQIEGVKKLNDVSYNIMPDRIETGTFLCAAAMSQGNIIIENTNINHITPIISKLEEANCKLKLEKDKIELKAPKKLKALEIRTMPYPGFPTDMQSIFVSMLTIAKGTSIIVENIFESRYKFTQELIRMGAKITIEGKSAIVKGTEFTVILECETSGVTVKREPIPELKGARALVVDDDAETCMSVSKMLREIEMTADWTTSGKEAVLRAREAYEQNQEFKVYIIDWLMPDMNGIETVRRIRMVVGPESPIIILTAYDWSDVEQEAREAGVTAFVSKPLFLSELREVLMSPEQRKLIQNENQKIQAASQTSYAGKKVLLVEDNELNREIATAIMEEIGLDVDVAEDGTDAVNIMSSERGNNYDLIFMDIQMPKMDGYTATREIRTLNNSKCANIPIIAMTANAFEEDRKKAIKAGMNGHIAKPISSDVILENLDQIFGR